MDTNHNEHTTVTPRQEKYVQELIAGKSQRQAYIAAYPAAAKWKPEAVDTQASILLRDSKIHQRFEELKAGAAKAATLSRIDKLRMLEKIARANIKDYPMVTIAAIKVHNEMTGDNVPQKAEVSIDILAEIAERHRDYLERQA